MERETGKDIDHLLPLAPVALEILLALAEGERHGYAIAPSAGSRAMCCSIA